MSHTKELSVRAFMLKTDKHLAETITYSHGYQIRKVRLERSFAKTKTKFKSIETEPVTLTRTAKPTRKSQQNSENQNESGTNALN